MFEVYFSVAKSRFDKLYCAALSEERSNRDFYGRGVLPCGPGALREALLRSSLKGAL